MADETTYVAQGLVNVAEGQMYGPGSVIEGDFDPDDDHNATLIEAGLISASTGSVADDSGDSGESPGDGAEAGSGQQDASAGATGSKAKGAAKKS